MKPKGRILIVDDDLHHGKVLTDILLAKGYESFIVTSGKAALGFIKEKPPCVALIDIKLGDMSGLEVIKEIKAFSVHIECIVITGYASQASAIEAINLGAYSYMQKPYNVEQLLITIQRAIEWIQAQEELHDIETRYRIMTESMQDTIWLVDMQFHYLWVSPSVIHSTGYSFEELIDLPLDKYLSPVSFHELDRQIREKLNPENLANPQAEIILSGEYECYRKDGSSFWGDTVLTLLRDAEGKPNGFLGIGRDITERKRSEEALRREQRLLRTLIDNLPDSIYAKDATGRKTLSNPTDLAHIGAQTEADVLGKTDWELFPEEVAKNFYTDDMAVIQTGQPLLNREEQSIDSKGRPHWALTSKIPLRDEEGQVVGLVGIGLDITTRKQAEEKIHDLYSWFKGVIDSLDSPIFSLDKNSCYTSFNSHHAASIKAHYGVDIEIGMPFIENQQIKFNHNQAKTNIKRALSGEHFTDEIFTGDVLNTGECLEVTHSPIKNPQGEIVGVAVFARDITKRKRDEESLRQSEEKLSKIFNTTPDAIFLSTIPKGIILEANDPALKMFGYSQEEFIGHTTAELGAYVNLEDRSNIYRKISEQGLVRNEVAQLIRRSGEIFWASISGNTINLTGKHYGLFILRDITQQKLLENRLYQSQKLESIGQLAAGIAHEINTPTQFVGDNIRFLQNGFMDILKLHQIYHDLLVIDKQNKFNLNLVKQIEDELKNIDFDYLCTEIPLAIQQSLDGTHRIAEIVHAMKAFSHPGGEKTAVDINKSLQDTITVARNEWKYVATVETHLSEDLPPVICYPDELNQVFLNILVNAAHAIADVVGKDGNKQGKIMVSTTQDGEWVEVRIKDSGTGIPEKIRSKIFDPFFTTKEVGKGTGQGLAISYDVVVNKHKGALTFETEMDKGTEFIIRLPITTEK